MKKVSLYIHLPFCLRKCLFCSFAIAVGQEHRRDDYVQALIKEMNPFKNTLLSSVYLGGGTPSTLEEGQLKILMDAVRGTFILEDGCEISMEANPEDITVEKLGCMKAAGVNRLSIGVQSFNDRHLKFLGRAHSSIRAKEAFVLARQAGLKNISGDLMYGFPGQTLDELNEDINQMTATGVNHLSIYTLTVEANSRFYAQALKLDDDEKLAEHYRFIISRLQGSGLMQYEVSNFAREGFMSAHNRHYWLGGEYIGLGMGAHGYLKGRRYWNEERLTTYLQRMSEGAEACQGYERLSLSTQLKEKLIFGLRMNEGVDTAVLFEDADKMLTEGLSREIDSLVKGGFLSRQGKRLKVTDVGRMALDEIAVKLV